MTRDDYRRRYYFRSIDRRWKQELERAGEQRVMVFSPYLTSRTAELVIGRAKAEKCEVYTVFSTESFVNRSSSLETVRVLLERGYGLYHIDGLHAKMVIVTGRFASFGSQDLTHRGTKNREVSIVVDDLSDVQEAERLAEEWVEHRMPITSAMVEAIEARLGALQEASDSIRGTAVDLDKDAFAVGVATLVREQVAERLSKLQAVFPAGVVSRRLAERFVEASAWWLNHPSGPVRAPGHARRIKGPGSDWQVEFGSNTFLVNRAILRCRATMEKYLADAEKGHLTATSILMRKLRKAVSGSVANYDGAEYWSYPVDGTDMRFGTNSIDVEDFVRFFLALVPPIDWNAVR